MLFAALMVASLSSVATAGASTATITGGPSVNGTAGATVLRLHNSGKSVSCTSSSSGGTVAASTTGAIPPGFRVGTVTPGFSGCTVVGGVGITVVCQPSALNVNANTVGGSTKGSIAGIDCHIFRTTATACRMRVTGGTGATVNNAAAGTGAMLNTDTNHQNLVASASTDGAGSTCAILPNDTSARFVDQATLSDVTYTLSPTNLNVNVTP
jgi:hypothetical protein